MQAPLLLYLSLSECRFNFVRKFLLFVAFGEIFCSKITRIGTYIGRSTLEGSGGIRIRNCSTDGLTV